jgi:hypothetical protein
MAAVACGSGCHASQQGCNVFKKSHVFLVMSFWSLKK